MRTMKQDPAIHVGIVQRNDIGTAVTAQSQPANRLLAQDLFHFRFAVAELVRHGASLMFPKLTRHCHSRFVRPGRSRKKGSDLHPIEK